MNDPFAERAAITVAGLLEGNIASLEKRAPKLIEKHAQNPEVVMEIQRRAIATLKTLQGAVEKEVTSVAGQMELFMAKTMIGSMVADKEPSNES